MEMWSLFHKTAATIYLDVTGRKLWIWLALMLCIAGICAAQEPAPENQEGENPPPDQSQPELLEPIPVPISVGEEGGYSGGQSFVDDVFQNARNHWGFALSAYQAYTSDLAVAGHQRQGSGITAVTPRIFFNAGKRKSKLHIDLGTGYRFYDNHRDLNTLDYYGDAQYGLQLSRRTSFQLADQFTSSFNDAWSFISLYSPLHYNLYSSNEVVFNRQRINRNALTAELNHQATRKLRLEAFGEYRSYRYPQSNLRDSDTFEVGGGLNYQAAKWFYLTSSFSTYFNLYGAYNSNARIYRLQAGGLDFRLTHSWRIWASGGVDVADYEKSTRATEDVAAGIGYTAENASFSITYQRGFTTTIGIARLLQSDIFGADFRYRLTRRLNAKLQSYYYRSSERYYTGLLETFSGGGGFEYALSRSLLLTLNSFYQNQRSHDFSVEGLGIRRINVYLGLQYLWPALRHR